MYAAILVSFMFIVPADCPNCPGYQKKPYYTPEEKIEKPVIKTNRLRREYERLQIRYWKLKQENELLRKVLELNSSDY